MDMYYVKLTYFKGNGKFYSSGSYISEHVELYRIWEEVRRMQVDRKLPGLIPGSGMPFISVKVPQHPNKHPHLVVDTAIET
jgi:hypothetical protein